MIRFCPMPKILCDINCSRVFLQRNSYLKSCWHCCRWHLSACVSLKPTAGLLSNDYCFFVKCKHSYKVCEGRQAQTICYDISIAFEVVFCCVLSFIVIKLICEPHFSPPVRTLGFFRFLVKKPVHSLNLVSYCFRYFNFVPVFKWLVKKIGCKKYRIAVCSACIVS